MLSSINTKIIATIGPASLRLPVLQEMVNEGIDYVRINTAYGSTSQYDLILDNLKQIKTEKKIEVILDIKDLDKIEYALKNRITNIALSFVHGPEQVEELREKIPSSFIISKIESKRGVENFDSILGISDSIMVARGDLGRAVFLEKVPVLQKEFTLKTLKQGKFLITATEMLLSMVNNPQPSRAEVSDVANAVFDQSSAVMLSEETAIGKYPVPAVRIMRKIIEEAEKWNCEKALFLK